MLKILPQRPQTVSVPWYRDADILAMRDIVRALNGLATGSVNGAEIRYQAMTLDTLADAMEGK